MTLPSPPEREGLRQAMAWLHTWSGLVLEIGRAHV